MKSYKWQTAVLVLLSFALGCSEFIVVGILSDIASGLHVPVTVVGNLVTIFALVYAIATPIVASFLGRFNRYAALLLMTVVFLAGNLLSFFAGSYGMLFFSRVVTAVVSGPMIAVSFTFANQIAPREQKAYVISWVFSGFSIASVFGVPIGAWISGRFGWRMAFLSIAAFSVVVILLLALSLPHRTPISREPFFQQFRLFGDRRIQLGVLLPFFGSGAVYVFYTYLRPILNDVLRYPDRSITLLLFCYGLCSIFSNQFSGVLAQHGGLRRMPAVFVVEAALLLTMPLSLRSRLFGTAAVMAVGILMYLLNSPIQMHFLTIANRGYPESVVMASSLNSIFFNFGISFGSLVGGAIVSGAGLAFVGVGGGTLSLAALGLTLALNVYQKRRAAPDAPAR